MPGFWFEDRKCSKCGEQEIIDHSPFMSSFSDAAKLGTHIGVYKALGNGKMEKMFNDALDNALTAKGLKRSDLKRLRTKGTGGQV